MFTVPGLTRVEFLLPSIEMGTDAMITRIQRTLSDAREALNPGDDEFVEYYETDDGRRVFTQGDTGYFFTRKVSMNDPARQVLYR